MTECVWELVLWRWGLSWLWNCEIFLESEDFGVTYKVESVIKFTKKSINGHCNMWAVIVTL